MKYLITYCFLMFVVTIVAANDSVKIEQLKEAVSVIQKKCDTIQERTINLRQNQQIFQLQVDSLQQALLKKEKQSQQKMQILDRRIEQIQTSTDRANNALSKSIQSRTSWGVMYILVLLMILVIAYSFLHKRINRDYTDISILRQKADKLNEDILNQFSLDMMEMQKISASLTALSSVQIAQVNAAVPDHSLIMTLADRITFMEMTLYKMDKTIKGHKTLTTAISNMKNNLFANGYEIVDMLGKPYNEGLSVNNTDFVNDETLQDGERIITKIVKPQINYKGQMIQSAQIQVSQNI